MQKHLKAVDLNKLRPYLPASRKTSSVECAFNRVFGEDSV
jgi:hypothetical protein